MNSNKPQKTTVCVVEISSAQLNQRLDNFLIRQLGDMPRTRIYRIIRKGEVRVNKKRCRPDYKLQIGDLVRIPPVRLEPERSVKSGPPGRLLKKLEQEVLFENEHILIIDKPAGLAVHSGSGVDYGVIDAARLLRPQCEIELVHRLDRDTSGCLMLAKHRQSLLAMQALLQDNLLVKNYRAMVQGNWPADLVEITHPLQKFHLANGERRVRVDAGGKPACSLIRLLQSGNLFSVIQVELVTGRTHQIRVHCQAEGHAIAGDDKYGDPEFNRAMRQRGIRRLMLHASSLELPRSSYTPELVINAPLPAEFEGLPESQGPAQIA
ncbi:MAG: RluA family pseudouridine synthase [Gammaproteobacteria bacterium]|nr:RluA family pseudouridine synthase [Gammaproteobacteria bacterium]MDH3537468.1 RluA family pseudouridine synthase [Gammaproteobacteria bacterium]